MSQYHSSQVGRPPKRRTDDNDDGGGLKLSRRSRSSTGNPVGRPKKARTEDGSDRRRRRRRRQRDPAAPKKPQNAFLQFCQEQRTLVSAEYERDHGVTLGKKELTKVLGQRWTDLGSEQKKVILGERKIVICESIIAFFLSQVYQAMFEREKAKYNSDLATYKQSQQQGVATAESLLKQQSKGSEIRS